MAKATDFLPDNPAGVESLDAVVEALGEQSAVLYSNAYRCFKAKSAEDIQPPLLCRVRF